MNDLFNRKMKMYLNVLVVLKKYINVWTASVPFKKEVDQLETNLTTINTKSQKLQNGTQAVSENKKQLTQELLDATLMVCGAGTAYASQINDQELKSKFNYSKTNLQRGKDMDFYLRCLGVSKEADVIQEQLKAFNLPEGQLELLSQKSKDYDLLIVGPIGKRGEDKSSREEIEVLTAEIDTVLGERLDKMMMIYKSNVDFMTEYSNARFIGGWSKGNDNVKPKES